jgi:hypothetical protein
MNLELKPCPFCGGEAIIRDVASYRYTLVDNKLFEVGCTTDECHACIYEDTPTYSSREEAVLTWNNRTDVKYWPCGVHKAEDGWQYLGSVSSLLYKKTHGMDIYRHEGYKIYSGISMQYGPNEEDYYSNAYIALGNVPTFEQAILLAYAIRFDRVTEP